MTTNSNEQTIKAFVEDQNAKAITSEWVIWVLQLISDANANGRIINPEWLRANRGTEDGEPAMIYE